jgi:hypothetical protein
MAKNAAKPHPDDFMSITIALAFQAKAKRANEPPLGVTETEITLPACEAADYLDGVLKAIRERRLYAHMLAEAAESHILAGQWLGLTMKEIIAEARARSKQERREPRLPGLSRVRRDD